jgi:hypothetical protein
MMCFCIAQALLKSHINNLEMKWNGTLRAGVQCFMTPYPKSVVQADTRSTLVSSSLREVCPYNVPRGSQKNAMIFKVIGPLLATSGPRI